MFENVFYQDYFQIAVVVSSMIYLRFLSCYQKDVIKVW